MRNVLVAAAIVLTAPPAAAGLSAGVFVPAPSMSFARYTASAAALADGSVVLYGPSYNGDRYDTTAGLFVETGLIPAPRFAGRLLALPDGRALLVGGSTTDARTVRYDPGASAWSWGSPMESARMAAQVATLDDGRMLVAGGYGADGVALATAELYDPTRDAFSATGTMPRARQGGIAEVLVDGTVLVAGGVDATGYGDPCAVLYSPTSATFTDGPCFSAAPEGLYTPASARLDDGRVLVSGGLVFTGSSSQRVATDAEVYDPNADTWTGHPASARAGHTLTALADGTVLVAGGHDDWGQPIGTSEIFDARTDLLRPGPSMVAARFGHTATTLPGNRVLVAGGQVGGGQWTASSEIYTADAVFAAGFER